MSREVDVAVVGAGVLGLAHAYHLANRGLRVVVFERTPVAQGASIRNFGMLWPIGQPPGKLYRLARRSLEVWRGILSSAGIDHEPVGSLHLAYHDDEAMVLNEFVSRFGRDYSAEMLTPAQIVNRFPAVRQDGLRGGMFSPVEVTVDARKTLAALPYWLQRTYGVEFAFGTTVLGYDSPRVETTAGEWTAPRMVVCAGVDFRDLAPQAFMQAGLVPCKLQMMRSQAYSRACRVGVMLAAGLTLRHYRAFADCVSLPALIQRFDREMPEYGRYGIHVLLSQNSSGELFIGDSHEYGNVIEPFDKAEIDDLILRYLHTFVAIPDLRIAARWHGIYVKHPTEPYVVAHPQPGMMAVAGVGGNGMTLSCGLAEQTIADFVS